MARRVGLFVTIAAALSAGLAAQTPQPPPAGTAVIVGRVVDGLDGTSLPGAIVTIAGGRMAPRSVLVDGQGRFLFLDLPAGSYALTATRPRYLDGAFGRTRPDGDSRTIDLRDGERVTDAAIRMWRPAIISGTVTDDAGDPVAGSRVLIFTRTIVAGRWRFVAVGRPLPTDDRGMYRTPALTPGEYTAATASYVISAPAALVAEVAAIRRAGGTAANDFMRTVIANGAGSPLSDLYQGFEMRRIGDMFVNIGGPAMPTASIETAMNLYSTVWSPAAASPAQASVVSVGPGDDRPNVDLHLTLSPTVRVSGTVTGPDGPVASFGLRLLPAGLDDVADEASLFVADTATASDGTFTFAGVHAGQYVIRGGTYVGQVDSPAGGKVLSRDPTLWISTPLSVGDANVTGISVAAHAGVRVTGRVEFDGSSPKPSPKDLRTLPVRVEPIDGRPATVGVMTGAQIDPTTGAFYTAGLVAGRYFIRASGSVGPWTLKSAVVNGRDVADVPLTVDANDIDGLVLTLTDHPSGLRGQVRSSQGAPDADATVIVFPADPSGWRDAGASPRRLRSVRASRTGSYSIGSLPPGDYDVIAVNDAAAARWQDPALLQQLARSAAHVTILDGQQASFDLTTVLR